MKKILIAAVLIFITGIISSCSKPAGVTHTTGHGSQMIITGDKKIWAVRIDSFNIYKAKKQLTIIK